MTAEWGNPPRIIDIGAVASVFVDDLLEAGLPVRRHTIDDVRRLLGPDFTVVTTRIVDHVRPDGETQQYLWTLARR